MNLSNSPDPFASSPQPAPVERSIELRFLGVRPIVTYILIGLTIGVFLLQMLSQSLFQGVDYPALIGLKANKAILAGDIWRLFTPILLHGSILHIAFNMYALYVLGPGLEFHYGHARFLALYLLAGFAGNVASFLLSDVYSLGASTAIFGLVAAEAIFVYHNRRFFGVKARAILQNILVISVINIVIGFSGRIDQLGHLGGALGGLIFAWLAGPRLAVEGIFPAVALVDGREQTQVWLAAAGVGALFVLLAALKFLVNFL